MGNAGKRHTLPRLAAEMEKVMEKKKTKLAVPHVYVLLIGLILICSLLSYVVPAGQYDMVTVDGREIVDSTTYHAVEQTPVSLMQFLSAIPR